MVIFGATGDLTKRKLMPALYRLAYERRLPSSFAIVGNSRTPLTDDEFREKMHEAVKQFLENSPFDEELWTSFARNLYYIAGDLNDLDLYQKVNAKLTELALPNALFYLSTQPSYYGVVAGRLGEAVLASRPGGLSRDVIVKTLGRALASAQALPVTIQ